MKKSQKKRKKMKKVKVKEIFLVKMKFKIERAIQLLRELLIQILILT